MAISRSAATTYVVGRYGTGANNLLSLADIGTTDVTGALKEVIDDAALLLGVAYDDLATAAPSDAIAYFAALRYYALQRIISGLNAKSQQGVAQVGQGVSLDVRDWIKRLQGELMLAASECIAAGLAVSTDGTSSWAALGDQAGMLGINLDYLQQPVEYADA